jgi:predicted  nucleic acid-binding Zn-ribbon protein
MKKITGVLTALLLLLQVGGAFAQTSDYETIQTFKQRNQTILGALKAAQDLQQCAALDNEITRLESEYAPHRALLAEGLHPETFDSTIATLRDQARRATERVRLAEESKQDKATITTMTVKAAEDAKTIEKISRENVEYQASIAKLSQEVKDLSARIEQLTTENTALLEQVKALQAQGKKDRATIAKLQELTEKLNQNIRDRDALVIKMMDSLFAEYAKGELTDAQKKDLFVSVQGNDYVGTIVTTLDQNVKYSESALFTAQDLKAVQEEQRKLSAKWEEIKPYVAKIYPDEQSRVRDIATVDGRVADWKKSVDATTWKSIRQVFVGQNMDIGPFGNAAEFHTRLLAFVDGQIANPSRAQHQAFRQKVWDSPIKDQWLPLIPADELTAQQRTEIDQKIAAWDEAIAAQLRRWVLIGVLGAVVLAAVVLLLRKKKPATA